MAGLLREAKILDMLQSKKSDYFCECKGIFYRKNNTNLITDFVLITTAGDCSVHDLKEIRKIAGSQSIIYSENEALGVLSDLSQAFSILKNLNIYHSDVKPRNIVYNSKKKKYQLIDFGVSKEIEPNADGEYKIEEYGLAGTQNFYSPEKSAFIQMYNKSSDLESNIEKLQKQNNKSEIEALKFTLAKLRESMKSLYFDPFKCDIYSLGKSIQTILSEQEREKFEILKDMMNPNWKSRMNIKDLMTSVSKMVSNRENATDMEIPYLNLIEKKRKEKDFKEYYKNYDEAYMPFELLSVATEELRVFLESNPISTREKEEEKAEIKFRRGLALRKNGYLIEAETELKEVLQIQASSAQNNKAKLQKTETLLALSAIMNERGDREKAEQILKEAFEIRKEIHGSDNHVEVLHVSEELAIHKGRLGANGDAAEELEVILEKLKKQFNEKQELSTYIAIAKVLFSLSKQWSLLYQYKRAIHHLKIVAEMRKKIHGTEKHPEVASVYEELAINHGRLKEFETAIENLDSSLNIRKSINSNENHPQIAFIYYQKGKHESYLKKYDLAIENIKRAYQIWKLIFQSEKNSNVFSANQWLEYLEEKLKAEKKV